MIRIATYDTPAAGAFTLAPPAFPALVNAASPTATYEALRDGQADVALLPTARLRELESLAEPIGHYGIACRGAVFSEVACAKYPIETIVEGQLSVYSPPEAQTAQKLFLALCRLEYGAAPSRAESVGECSARLYVGLDAINATWPAGDWPVHLDLGQWWFDTTSQPLVFARWVVRNNLDYAARNAVENWLGENAAEAGTPEGREQLMLAYAGHMPSRDFGHLYFNRIRAELTVDDLWGQETFLSLLEEQEQCAPATGQ